MRYFRGEERRVGELSGVDVLLLLLVWDRIENECIEGYIEGYLSADVRSLRPTRHVGRKITMPM